MNSSKNEALNADISEKANRTRFAESTVTEKALARAILVMAANASMPDTFWQSDSRIVAACDILGWSVEDGRFWAFDAAPSRPTWDELLTMANNQTGFYEDDEPMDDILSAFENGEPFITTSPDDDTER